MDPRATSRGRGVSLVEALTALTLLGIALISVAGIFLLGPSRIRAAREGSSAYAVGREVLTHFESLGFHELLRVFGADDGSSGPAVIDSADGAYAERWRPALEAALQEGSVRVELQSVEPSLPFSETRVLRIEITVSWREGRRVRRVSLMTLRN